MYRLFRIASRLGRYLRKNFRGMADLPVSGVVAGLPQAFERGVRFDFDVESPETGVPRRIVLSSYGGFAPDDSQGVLPVRAGERWRFTVRLRRPHGGANPHGFDYEAWLLERGVRATGYVRMPSRRAGDEGAQVPPERLAARVPRYWIEGFREEAREKIRGALPEHPYAGILVALAIGDQNAIDPGQWQLFARTGVSHLMSISGLHVTMVAGPGDFLRGYRARGQSPLGRAVGKGAMGGPPRPRSPAARAVPAGIARLSGRQRARDPAGELRHHPARARRRGAPHRLAACAGARHSRYPHGDPRVAGRAPERGLASARAPRVVRAARARRDRLDAAPARVPRALARRAAHGAAFRGLAAVTPRGRALDHRARRGAGARRARAHGKTRAALRCPPGVPPVFRQPQPPG